MDFIPQKTLKLYYHFGVYTKSGKYPGFYNTMYSRMSRALDKLPGQESEKDISEEEFKNWSKKYSNAKRNYKNGIISGDEMLSIIREGYV